MLPLVTMASIGVRGLRQGKMEGRALALFGLYPNLPTVTLDNPVYNRKPNARAFIIFHLVQAAKHLKQPELGPLVMALAAALRGA